MKKKRIAVDFDGTIVTHEFPEIGDWVPGCKRKAVDWGVVGPLVERLLHD